jgi:Arc/MetJ-type ribon-helix-helix transcriptional regulator
MSAKTVGFAITEEDQATLQALVDHFGHGNRSEFLRAAMKRMTHDMWAEKMRGFQDQAHDELAGRVVSREEVTALVKKTLRSYGAA